MVDKLRALLIEDDVDIRSLLVEVLDDAEIDVVSAEPSALPASSRFSVIVTDLPHRDGYSPVEARAWIESLSTRFAAPIVIITARQEARADEYLRRATVMLQKPIDIEELVATIRAAANDRA